VSLEAQDGRRNLIFFCQSLRITAVPFVQNVVSPHSTSSNRTLAQCNLQERRDFMKVLTHSNVIRVLPNLQGERKSLLARYALSDFAYIIGLKLFFFLRYLRPSCLIFMLANLKVKKIYVSSEMSIMR